VVSRVDEAFECYVAYLASSSSSTGRAQGRKILLDTAQGAAFRVAPEVFRRLGFRVACLGDQPDGRNINDGCGALEPAALAARLREGTGGLGFAFDGDGDRMIPVTAGGVVLDGDHVLYLCGSRLLREGRLPRSTIVATVMSNLGLEVALRKMGVDLLRVAVGDRNVYRTMIEEGYPLGGEQSGHVIFLDDARTGDGTLAAIRCLDSLGDSLDLDAQAAQAVPRFPQLLRNVAVTDRRHLDDIPALREAIREAESSLGAEGRVVVRYSGTEPLLRVMVEGADGGLVKSFTESICQAIPDELRAPA
jgi:phosphoglucosamine mutase